MDIDRFLAAPVGGTEGGPIECYPLLVDVEVAYRGATEPDLRAVGGPYHARLARNAAVVFTAHVEDFTEPGTIPVCLVDTGDTGMEAVIVEERKPHAVRRPYAGRRHRLSHFPELRAVAPGGIQAPKLVRLAFLPAYEGEIHPVRRPCWSLKGEYFNIRRDHPIARAVGVGPWLSDTSR